MSFWFSHGLLKGIQSTRYPRIAESAPGASPGRPVDTEFPSDSDARETAASCPANAIIADGKMAVVDDGACIHCQRCRFGIRSPMNWELSYEWTQLPPSRETTRPYHCFFQVLARDGG